MTTSGGIPQVLPTFFFDMGLSLILVLTKQAGQQALPPLHWLYKRVPPEADFFFNVASAHGICIPMFVQQVSYGLSHLPSPTKNP